MPDLIYLLAILVCPVGMGLMMLMMMRGGNSNRSLSATTGDEVARLRAEVEQLRAQDPAQARPSDTTIAP